jgi:hypothetical protein
VTGQRGVAFPFVVAATGLVAATPILVATAQAFRLGWIASTDDGVIATRAFDVLSGHSPLVGQWTQASSLIDKPTYSPGPLLYWLLAVPAQVGSRAMLLTMGALSAACVVGAVAIAYRRGGQLLMLAAAVALSLTCRSLPVEVPYDIWNTWAGVFSLVFSFFLAWSVGCGDVRVLPLLVAVESYVVQCSLAYVVPVLVGTSIAVGGLAAGWRGRSQAERLRVRRWSVLAVLVGVVCWSAPLLQEVRERPGNLELIHRVATDDHATAGLRVGWNNLTRAVGLPPSWTRAAPTFEGRVFAGAPGGTVRDLVTISIILALIGLIACAWRRRKPELVVALALGLGLCASVVAVAASVPAGPLGYAAGAYVLIWTSAAGMFVWLVLAWSAWVLLAPAPLQGAVMHPRLKLTALGAAAVLAVVVSLRPAKDPTRLPPGNKDFPSIRDATARVVTAVGHEKDVLVVHVGDPAQTFETAIIYALRRHGVTPAVHRKYLVTQLGKQYSADSRRYRAVVTVGERLGRVTPAGQVLVRRPEVTVTIRRD